MTERALTKTVVFYLVPDFTMLAFTSAVEALRLANAVLDPPVDNVPTGHIAAVLIPPVAGHSCRLQEHCPPLDVRPA